MSQLLVRLEGNVEQILENLVAAGFFKTKTEAIRAGILELGREYHAVRSKEELMDELAARKMQMLEADARAGKRKVLTEADVLKKYPHLRD